MGPDRTGNTRGRGALERPDSVVPRQVKREQLRVRSMQVHENVRLPGLDAGEADDLRHLGDDRQDVNR